MILKRPDWNLRMCGRSMVCFVLLNTWGFEGAALCPPDWDEPELQSTINDERLPEISGMVSARDLQTFWVHNDSGYEPVIYRISSEGAVLQEVRVEGADSIDWEDLAWGECPSPSSSRCLFIGDFGDNSSRRDSVQIYVIEEPDALAESVALESTIEFVYEDGPRDAEAMIVDPNDGEIYVFEKTVSPHTGVYRVRDGVATRQATFETSEMYFYPNTITAADISDDGSFVVARTYLNLYVFCRGEDTLSEALNAPVGSFPSAQLVQPEALAIDSSGSLWSTTEGLPARFYRRDFRTEPEEPDMGGSDVGAQSEDMAVDQGDLRDAGVREADDQMETQDMGAEQARAAGGHASGCTTTKTRSWGPLATLAVFIGVFSFGRMIRERP